MLIDAANLRAGGAVQVASSFIDELSRLRSDDTMLSAHPWLANFIVELSPEVYENLSTAVAPNLRVQVRKWHDIGIWCPTSNLDYTVSFTLFGPLYGVRRAVRQIVGFADGAAIFPNPQGVPPRPLLGRARHRLRSAVSIKLHKDADHLVFESPSTLERFRQITNRMPPSSVVPNVINDVFSAHSPSRRRGHTSIRDGEHETLTLCYVARGYPHKNHELLPAVQTILLERNISVKFVVTLDDEEWTASSAALKRACINVGSLTVKELPDLYQSCDAVIFPSLLESFSVTPLEGLEANGLLFASDRDFVRSVCGEAPIYFDPLSPASCANAIESTFRQDALIAEHRIRAREVVAGHPTARDRAVSYTELISQELGLAEGVS